MIHRTLQRGFTLIEMLVIAPIVILAIGAFLTVIISMTGEVLSSRGSNVLTYNVQDALNRIEQDVKLSTTFLATNTIPLVASEAQGYNNDATAFTNVGGTSGTSLILNTLATTDNPLVTTSGIVYQKDKPNACGDSRVTDNTPMSSNIVYFVKGDTLWRRTIMPSNYANLAVYCASPWQRPSCAPGYTAVFCKTEDIKLVEGVTATNFSVNYYSSAGSTTIDTVASDPNATLAARSTALQSLSTVGVAINASQNVAGRTIERSASVRVSRLDTNASTIAPVVEATIPGVPSLSASVSSPTSVIYTWPKLDGADSYTFQYNINGGAWQTGVNNQNVNTYTVTAGTHSDTVNGRVSATSSLGTSAYSATSTITIPRWTTPLLQNSWSDYSTSYASAGYTKTSTGVVVLKGLIKRTGSVVANEILFTLPQGYRPQYQLMFNQNITDYGTATVYIDPAGNVRAGTSTNATNTSLSGISFISSEQAYTWTNLTMSNGWSNRGNVDDPPLSYTFDSIGRAHLRGHLSPGTTTAGTVIATLPTSIQVNPKLIVAIRSGCGGANVIDIGSTITFRGVCPGSILAPNLFYYPDSSSGWTGLSLNNGWVVFNTSNASPAYIKASDGIVTLKGLIKSGTTTNGTTLATLPASFRPAETHNYACVSNDLPCRISIHSDGTIRGYAIDATWVSLSGLNFIAEQ